MTISVRARVALALAVSLAGGAGLAGCGGARNQAADAGVEAAAPGCGDGVLDPGEECDAGRASSDTAPDACRTTCRKAACGDGVRDTGEACDDGNPWGGDGCTPACTLEDPPFEKEPNDDLASATPWVAGVIHGALKAGDRDCFSFMMADCSAVKARLTSCPAPATITLVDPGGNEIATGGPAADRCATLDPAEAAGARFVLPGRYAVCVDGLLGAAVPWYALEITLVDAAVAAYPLSIDDDRDRDGKPDRCDPDLDGDGVNNDVDNCMYTPNGPAAPALKPMGDGGFVRQWLTVGPFTGRKSGKDCRPTDDNLVAVSDAAVRPALGDKTAVNEWIVLWSARDRLEFLDDYGKVDAPREVYQAVYLRSDAARDLTLGVGPDDGARVWWNGAMVLDITPCQGTVVDSSTAPVKVLAGWNTLVIKVYDQGGGWGNYVRLLDKGVPVTDLEVSLSPAGSWAPDQADSDGDGIGDVCDKTPK